MNSIRSGVVLAVVAAAVLVLWALQTRGRSEERAYLEGLKKEWIEASVKVEAQNHLLLGLQSKIERLDDRLTTTDPALTTGVSPGLRALEGELRQLMSTLAAQQSNTLAWVHRPSTGGQVGESPEADRMRTESAVVSVEEQLAEQQQKVEAASQKMEELRTSLAVPDDVAIRDADKALDDPRLRAYRPYFEALQARDSLRRYARVIEMKLVAAKVEARLPRSK
jgi:hypothetical protein